MSTSVSGVSNHFPSAENGFTTTTSGSVASGATTVGLNSTTGYANGETVVFVIDPTNTSKKQTFTGVIDTSGNQVTGVVWTAGSNVAHDAGATVVDYATATHISMVSKGILVDHSQSGGHEIATNYDPSNPTLETQKWVGVSSAVNEITLTNAVTGSPPIISATGNDTNIDVKITPKGTGKINLNGPTTNPYSFGAWDSGGTSLTDNTAVKVAFATELYDYNSNFATSTYTAPVAGVYHFDFSWGMGVIASGVLKLALIYKNGAEIRRGGGGLAVSSGGANVSADILLAAGDTIDFYAFQDSAGVEGTVQDQTTTWCNGHLVHAT